MSEETLLVFKMLQEGKLTPEQAEALLKAIPVEDRKHGTSGNVDEAVDPEAVDDMQSKLSALQARLAEVQHHLGSAGVGMYDRLRTQFGLKPALEDATKTLGAVRAEVIRSARLATRVAERQTRKLRAEARHAGRKLIDECRMELSHGVRPVNLHGVAEAVDVSTSSSPAPVGTHLDVVNPLGNVRVVKSVKPIVTVKATKTAWSNSSEVRQSRLNAVRVSGPVPDIGLTGLSIYVVPDDQATKDVTVDLEVAVPTGVRLSVETGFGDIAFDGVAASINRIESISGSVSILNTRHEAEKDAAKIRTRTGQLNVAGFQGGSLDVASAAGGIRMEDLSASAIKVKATGGDIAITRSKTTGAILVYAHSGNASLADIVTSAAVMVSVGSGDITASDLDAGSVELKTISGDVDIERVDTTVDKLAITTVSGDIAAREVLSDAVTIGTISGDAVLHFSDPVIRSLGASTVSGDITVKLTGAAGANVEMRTQSGELECDAPLSRSTEQTGQNVLSGVIGDGKGCIKIQSVSGDLRIGQ